MPPPTLQYRFAKAAVKSVSMVRACALLFCTLFFSEFNEQRTMSCADFLVDKKKNEKDCGKVLLQRCAFVVNAPGIPELPGDSCVHPHQKKKKNPSRQVSTDVSLVF